MRARATSMPSAEVPDIRPRTSIALEELPDGERMEIRLPCGKDENRKEKMEKGLVEGADRLDKICD